MSVLVDTSVWSLALRRQRAQLAGDEKALVEEWRGLVASGQLVLIGPIRQEMLSGIPGEAGYRRLRDQLRSFIDEPVTSEDHEQAAALFNTCRRAGITPGQADILICAVAIRMGAAILTADRDFGLLAAHVPVQLHPLSRT